MRIIVAVLWVLMLMTAGCRAVPPVETVPDTSAPEEITHAQIQTQPETGMLIFRDGGRVRTSYQGNRASVRYITESAQLPQLDAFADFDDAFFGAHALVLVTYTTGSGSAKPEISAIEIHGETAQVKLDIRMPGGESTDDMATWLVWAVVDRDLAYDWILENGTADSGYEVS